MGTDKLTAMSKRLADAEHAEILAEYDLLINTSDEEREDLGIEPSLIAYAKILRAAHLNEGLQLSMEECRGVAAIDAGWDEEIREAIERLHDLKDDVESDDDESSESDYLDHNDE